MSKEVDDLKKQLETKENELKMFKNKAEYCKKHHHILAKKLEESANKYKKVAKQHGEFNFLIYLKYYMLMVF